MTALERLLTAPNPDTAAPDPRPASPVALLQAQLRAIDLWHQALHAAEAATAAPGQPREARLDADRQLDVRRREQQVVLARAGAEDHDLVPLLSTPPLRAVLAHRHAWTRQALAAALQACGVARVEVVDHGADAVALCVLDQPALLVVDQVLAMRTGPEVVAEVRRLSPSTLIAGYVGDEGAVRAVLDAGAHEACTRRVPPAELASTLAARLSG